MIISQGKLAELEPYEKEFDVPDGKIKLSLRHPTIYQKSGIASLWLMDVEQGQRRLMQTCVVGWRDVQTEDGKAMPFTQENLEKVLTVVDGLLKQVNDHLVLENKLFPLTEEARSEEENFTAPPGESS